MFSKACAGRKNIKEAYEYEALKGIESPSVDNVARLEVVLANQSANQQQVTNRGNATSNRHNPTVDYSAMLDRRLQELVASGDPFFVMCRGTANDNNPTVDGSPFVVPEDKTAIVFEEQKKRRKKNKETNGWESYTETVTHRTVFRAADFVCITYGGLQSRCGPEHSGKGIKKQKRNKVLHFEGHKVVHDNTVSL